MSQPTTHAETARRPAGDPVSDPLDEASDRVHRRRWFVLAVLSLSVFVIVVDNTIVNVALPTLVRDLGATTSQLQWIVDAYTLVFAGLLLAAGSLGDRYGRKGALQLGMVAFGVFSAAAAFSPGPELLIAARGAMGVGAALIFPATLAILVATFRDPKERAMAIGLWAAVSGLAVAMGPVTGGWLLEHFWWGSVFLVNVPVVVVALVAIAALVPTSRDGDAGRFDPLGVVLSIAAVTLLVLTIIEAPNWGWTAPVTLAGFVGAVALLVGFVLWEVRRDHPMLDVRIFTNLRFTAGSVSVTFAFFALFGFIFVVTQYFQFVRGYGALEAGIRTVPFAVFTGIAAPTAAKLAQRIGTKVVVATGLAAMSVGFLIAATTSTVDSSYWLIVLAMFFMGGGLGLVNAPATEAIMGSLPPAKAGVGSAVNDTTRELGGTLGVAIVGSLFSSAYSATLVDLLTGTPLPAEALDLATESVGAGAAVAEQAGIQAGPLAGELVRGAVDTAFLDGFRLGSLVAAGVVAVGALVALRWLPARADEAAGAPAPEAAVVPAAGRVGAPDGPAVVDLTGGATDLVLPDLAPVSRPER